MDPFFRFGVFPELFVTEAASEAERPASCPRGKVKKTPGRGPARLRRVQTDDQLPSRKQRREKPGCRMRTIRAVDRPRR